MRRALDDLRIMKAECADIENALSYFRRLAQARIEILEAERDRRARGGSVDDLVKDLPRILSGESGRSSITDTRRAAARRAGDRAALARRSRATRGRHDAREPAARLRSTSSSRRSTRLRGFERELSDLRREMHGVIDTLEREIAGAAGRRDRGMTHRVAATRSKTRLHDLGDFIRDQRRNARLSLRKLSELAGISNPYLSQIERGLRKPSAEILQSIARGLRISAETLYVRAGILDEHDGERTADLVAAIAADPTLNERQKQALIEIYRSFQAEHLGREAEAG